MLVEAVRETGWRIIKYKYRVSIWEEVKILARDGAGYYMTQMFLIPPNCTLKSGCLHHTLYHSRSSQV